MQLLSAMLPQAMMAVQPEIDKQEHQPLGNANLALLSDVAAATPTNDIHHHVPRGHASLIVLAFGRGVWQLCPKIAESNAYAFKASRELLTEHVFLMRRHGSRGVCWAGGCAGCAVDGGLRRHGCLSGVAMSSFRADARAGRGPLKPRHLAHD